LDAYDLPLELRYLPVVESALNPKALSRRRASGLWQFILSTGKLYGLENNSLVDERRDPIKSTWAAARYLKDLYTIYKDWNLALAAYNCGPGNVNKAIRRAGGATDYWEIYHFLPRETRGYVPAFIAANYIMTYYCEHGICPMKSELLLATDTIQINKDLHLQQVAEVCGMDIEQLRSLNPQFKKDIVPGNSKIYALRLPNNQISQFIDKQDSIFVHKTDKYLNKRKTVAIKDSSSNSKGATYHRIRQGDTLGGIALKYGVSVNQLRRLNGIKGNNIRAGKTLRVR
jgi:membrane-bound lytic murein transglycosylase D